MPEAAILSFPQGEPALTLEEASASTQNQQANSRLSRRSGKSLLVMAAMFGICAPPAMLVPISGAVIATGETGSESRYKSIIHPSGGILSEIFVRDGEPVQAGQVLMKFETAVTAPGARYAGESLTSLSVRRARLEAEVSGASSFAPPLDLPGAGTAEAEQAITRERTALAVKQGELNSQLAMIEDQKRQIQAEIVGFREQVAALAKQRGLLAPELRGLRELYRKELVTINRLNEAERNDVTLAGETASLQSRIRQSQARLAEAENRSQSIRQTARSSASAELSELVLALADGKVREASAADALERSSVRAPQAGIVEALAFSTIGSAVPAGQEILRIIPQTGNTVVHARVSPADIDQVAVGQAARIRFSGFNQQTTPQVEGKVVFVSADRSEDPRSGAPFYRVSVSVDAKAFEQQTKLHLTTGMPAEVFITTSSRSLASYIFKPLLDQLNRAFRDEQ
jgi:HlyD family secretion protein